MSKHIANFTIGFFASLCAVFVPRIVTMLNGNGDIQYFHSNYIVVGIVFALIIGGITVIFEQAKDKTPAETFMTALGIPALLAGALNTGTASTELRNTEAVNQKLVATIQKQSGITEESASIQPLQAVPDTPHSQLDFSLISSAYAQDGPPNDGGLNLGIQIEQKPYVIVLEKSANKTEALQKAAALRQAVPQATVVQSNQEYLIIDSMEHRNKPDALLQALELQKRTNLKPSLLQIK